jgi:hypothetical protein
MRDFTMHYKKKKKKVIRIKIRMSAMKGKVKKCSQQAGKITSIWPCLE